MCIICALVSSCSLLFINPDAVSVAVAVVFSFYSESLLSFVIKIFSKRFCVNLEIDAPKSSPQW